jgi:8-oxo-dGTP diphosphatase
VEEETGLRCVLERELPSVEYRDPRGRPKRVRYWAMAAISGAFAPTKEIDEIMWLEAAQARARLSYERDVAVLESAGLR